MRNEKRVYCESRGSATTRPRARKTERSCENVHRERRVVSLGRKHHALSRELELGMVA